jgi:hypothetical protein
MGEKCKEAAKRAIRHYRALREWITDLRTRKALRDLIEREEAKLGNKPNKETK